MTPTVGKNLSRFQSLTLAAISSLWEAGAASSQSPETRSQPSCPSGISMTKGKESQVPRRQGCSRSSVSWTLYSMGPVSMDSIRARVSTWGSSSVGSRSEERSAPCSPAAESSSDRPDVLDQVREASKVCAEAVALAGSDGPLESAGVVESVESAESAGPTGPATYGEMVGGSSGRPRESPGWLLAGLVRWRSSARTSHSLPRRRAMKSVRRCSLGITAPGFRAARRGTAPRPRA